MGIGAVGARVGGIGVRIGLEVGRIGVGEVVGRETGGGEGLRKIK